MKQGEWVEQLDAELQSLVDQYVEKQDFHAIETPLKTDRQFKEELRRKLIQTHNFEALSKGMFNGVHLIHDYLLAFGTEEQIERVHRELSDAFKKLKELCAHQSDWFSQLDPTVPLWTSLYGVSDETLLQIYEIVLKCYQNNEIENAKDLLQLLLMFAPTVPAYWNALGLCFQTEGKFDEALNYYLISENINPEILDTHCYLARCYLDLNNHTLAKAQVEKLFKLIEESDELKQQWANQIEQLMDEI